MIERLIACCGISCNECPAFIATMNSDEDAKAKVAEEWSKQYDVNLKAEDINCKGCISRIEPVFAHCKVCEIRKCVMDKDLFNCAECDVYPCSNISKFHEMVPEAKVTLDVIHEERKN